MRRALSCSAAESGSATWHLHRPRQPTHESLRRRDRGGLPNTKPDRTLMPHHLRDSRGLLSQIPRCGTCGVVGVLLTGGLGWTRTRSRRCRYGGHGGVEDEPCELADARRANADSARRPGPTTPDDQEVLKRTCGPGIVYRCFRTAAASVGELQRPVRLRSRPPWTSTWQFRRGLDDLTAAFRSDAGMRVPNVRRGPVADPPSWSQGVGLAAD
jgi:hypothetical protein